MTKSINKVRNEDFSAGKAGPRGWVFESSGASVSWQRAGGGGGVILESASESGLALWSQSIACKPDEFYRVEAEVTCDLDACDDSAGCVLMVQPLDHDQAIGNPRVTPGVHRSSSPTAIRAFFQVPAGIRRVRLSVGFVGSHGAATIHRVRFLSVLEPDEASHSVSIPPPGHSLPPRKTAKRVLLCGEDCDKRVLRSRLVARLGDKAVSTARPSQWKAASGGVDAVLFLDEVLPTSIRSLTTLLKLAEDRIVVIPLRGLAALAGEGFAVAEVRQPDDLLYAKVVQGDPMTRGFALADIFPWDWAGPQPGQRVQRQLRKSGAMESYLTKHGYEVILSSMGNKETTSDRPICVRKETPGGGLIALDVEPVEAAASTASEPTVAMHMLLTILGHKQSALGQYVSPCRQEASFREVIRQMAIRLPHVVVHDADVPSSEVTDQLVTIGGEDPVFGASTQQKPAILIRSHLHGGDVESTYGALMWIKQLVRMAPHTCSYIEPLLSRFQLAWQPAVAPWETRDGWRRSGREASESVCPSLGGAPMAALVDVVSTPENRLCVLVPNDKGSYARYFDWLPRLAASFPPGQYFARTAPAGQMATDRDRIDWRRADYPLSVEVDSTCFGGSVHQQAIDRQAELVRIEVPGNDADFVANSIQCTDLVATTLEHVIGLQYGLIAVNRSSTPAKFGKFPPTPTGAALLVDRDDAMLKVSGSRAG